MHWLGPRLHDKLLTLFLLIGSSLSAQSFALEQHLRLPAGASLTTLASNNYTGGYYQWMFPQPLNHQVPATGSFLQRVFVGIRAMDAPILLVTEGYGADFATKRDHDHELARELQANLVVVEHRYFGKSQPANLDYRWLDTRQAADDVHAIRQYLGKVLPGPWISTGTSKGGQAALAHRMRHPQDVLATVVFGTAVKRMPFVQTTPLLQRLTQRPCGQSIADLQLHLIQGKDSLLPAFAALAARDNYDFGDLSLETVFDYCVLELPYSYWQSGTDCATIPAGATADSLVTFLNKVVGAKFYTASSRKRYAPAFYMFYHELGYYEYDTQALQKWLSQPAYPNAVIAPEGVKIDFDRTHLQGLRDLLETPAAHTIFFVYGEDDPWALQSVVEANRYEVPGGGHRVKIAELPSDSRADLWRRIRSALGLPR